MKCEATTFAGHPCPANAADGSRFCISHRILSTPNENANSVMEVAERTEPNTSNRTKEDTHVDEKKNVGFVPGLALLLSALALLLIGINQIKGTPSGDTLEKMMDARFAAMNDSIMNVVKNGDIINKHVAKTMVMHDLDNLQASVSALSASAGADADVAAQVDTIKKAVEAIKAKLAPALSPAIVVPPAPAAAAAAPPPAPVAKKEAPKGKEKK
jgi:hypothetical protein